MDGMNPLNWGTPRKLLGIYRCGCELVDEKRAEDNEPGVLICPSKCATCGGKGIADYADACMENPALPPVSVLPDTADVARQWMEKILTGKCVTPGCGKPATREDWRQGGDYPLPFCDDCPVERR